MILEILLFIFFWFTMCGLWHEAMHLLECERQHIPSSYMWLVFRPLPGLRCTYVGNPSKPCLIDLAGGLYTSLICFTLSILLNPVWNYLGWLFMTLGWTQLLYGLFETKYINTLSSKQYFIGRYFIYVVTVLVNLLIWWVML